MESITFDAIQGVEFLKVTQLVNRRTQTRINCTKTSRLCLITFTKIANRSELFVCRRLFRF